MIGPYIWKDIAHHIIAHIHHLFQNTQQIVYFAYGKQALGYQGFASSSAADLKQAVRIYFSKGAKSFRSHCEITYGSFNLYRPWHIGTLGRVFSWSYRLPFWWSELAATKAAATISGSVVPCIFPECPHDKSINSLIPCYRKPYLILLQHPSLIRSEYVLFEWTKLIIFYFHYTILRESASLMEKLILLLWVLEIFSFKSCIFILKCTFHFLITKPSDYLFRSNQNFIKYCLLTDIVNN